MPNAFAIKKHEPRFNPNKPDVYYFDVKLVNKVKKTGEGDEDYVLEEVEVVKKTKIQEVIDSQAGDVGLEAALKKFAITGDPTIFPDNFDTSGEVYDATGMPEDLIEADNYFKAMRAQFDALPDELKQGRDFNSFMKTITQAQFDAYIASLKPSKEDKPEGDGK